MWEREEADQSEGQEPQAAAHSQPKDSRSDLQTVQMASVSHILYLIDPIPLAAAWSTDCPDGL